MAYTAVNDNGSQVPFTIMDDIPFQCSIDRDDANQGDLFLVTGEAIVCSFPAPGEQNIGTKAGFPVAFKYREKEIVKVCVRKLVVFSIGIGVVVAIPACNVPSPILGTVEVNGMTFEGIPVSLTVTGPATISPTTVYTRADGGFSSQLTAFGPGDIIITATVTVNGFTESAPSDPIPSPCLT
ncbi:MAG TPA: hypothetical protein VMW83_15930 [Spirochaetia bacterium]|nr:hypothetical protein [Spirochaetia bacterium]